MRRTAIEYGEATWNWYPGCNGPDGVPCAYCWSRNRVLPRMRCPECRSLIPHLHPERMGEPLHVRKPTRFLTCFTGDWMNAPDDVIRQAIGIMELTPRHTFLTLTQQPERLVKFSPFPNNCYVGISVTHGGIGVASTGSITCLEDVEAKIKYISFEPLLGPVEFSWYTHFAQWVIIGAQSGPTVMPQLSWVQEIVEAADKAGVKVWLKNSLGPLLQFGGLCYPWAFRNGYLRQEVPE